MFDPDIDHATEAATIEVDTLNKLVRAASHCPRLHVTTNSELIRVAVVNDCVTKSHDVEAMRGARFLLGRLARKGDQVEDMSWRTYINASTTRRVNHHHDDTTTQAPLTHRDGASSRCHFGHTGGSRQDTHGTPVLSTLRRPWSTSTGTHTGPPGFHTTARELQTCTFEGPGASNTTKIPREDPQRKSEKQRK